MLAACRSDDGPAGPAHEAGREPGPSPVVLIDGQWINFTQPTAPVVPGRPATPSGLLTVGENVINSDFFGGWSNNVGNARVRELINGYSTLAFTSGTNFVPDPMVVAAMRLDINPDDSRTYTIRINENLRWSDGTPITAENYVFAFLYSYAPIVSRPVDDGGLGQNLLSGGNVYRGFFPYRFGETDVFEGARLLSTYEFSITVENVTQLRNAAGDITGTQPNFPNWWEVLYWSVGPSPMHIIAPNARVQDTGNGVRMTGDWNIDVLRSTVDNGSTGYRYTPTVTAGPYRFVSFSEADAQAVISVNPNYLGNYVGYKPMIEHIVVRQVANNVIPAEFMAGGIDLVVQAAGGTTINNLLDFAETGAARYFDYARNGYGFVDFKHHVGPTQFAEVRRAIAYCFDRDELGRQFTGGYGRVVHSQIGFAQWMYRDNQELVDSRLNPYTVNTDEAVRELEAGGWTLDAAGNPFVAGTSANPRHKRMPDGSLMPLHIYWFAANDQIGSIGESLLADNFDEVGITFTRHHDTDGTVFNNAVQGRTDPVYNMITRGAGFATAHSPWTSLDPDPATHGWPNTNYVSDPHLFQLAMAMRNTAPGDNETFFERWLEFIIYFNDQLIDIPLYSDIFFNFFRSDLQNFSHCALYPWTSALIRSWIG
jgi:peptide/nickel transport system substrate-binding protein